jgi:large subunit ribosomal protein L21
MRYAIIESGGKQYRAVVGESIDVDRLPNEAGSQVKLERVLFMADDGDVRVGTPTVAGVTVAATVVDHVSGRKLTHFRYSPKKRIRVKGGHRAQFTRLMVDSIGGAGETRKVSMPAEEPAPELAPEAPAGRSPRKAEAAPKKSPARKPAARKSTAGKSAVKKAKK